MEDPSTAALLDRFGSGETAAFAELVHRYEAPLLRHARALLGPGGPYEDAVQDAFMKLAQAPPELPSEVRGDPAREHGHLAAWLHRVTRNHCMDTMRSETRRKAREQERSADEATTGGLATVEESDTRAAVERKLGELPEDQREVLVLRLLGDKSYREIAEITGRKVGTVGWLISMGLKALSRELAPLLGSTGAATNSTHTGGLNVARGEMS